MALGEDLAEDGTSSPAASTGQVPQATPQDASEDLKCPICQNTINDEASVSWCRHTFCFSCILEWSCRRAVCPICQWPFYYLYRKVREGNYDVYRIVQHNSSASRARRGRSQPHSVERRRRHSSGRQHRRSSSRDRSGGRARAPERGRSRSPRRHHDGHSRAPHAQGHNPSSSRRRRQSRAQDSARDTARDEGRAPRPERNSPASSGRSERRQWGGRVSSRERRATRSRSRRRSRSTRHQTQREPQRRRDRNEGRAQSPQQQVPAYSRRSERRPRGGRVASREQRATRS